MRDGVYGLVAVVAWPALVWCIVEAGLRVVSGYSAGASQLALTGGCALTTIAAVHIRRAALAPLSAVPEDHPRG